MIFDLDGTLVDSVYEHVYTWRRALTEAGMEIPAFEIHKRIGMTGTLMLDALAAAFEFPMDDAKRAALETAHSRYYGETIHQATRLPGSRTIWKTLDARGIPWAIATSSQAKDADVLLSLLDLPSGATVVTQSAGRESKPSPEPFEAAAKKLHTKLDDSIVIGDAVWDMLASRRSGALGVGVLTGGYGREELVAAGAYRVYADVGELERRLGELGLPAK